jgi:hypothetical protein
LRKKALAVPIACSADSLGSHCRIRMWESLREVEIIQKSMRVGLEEEVFGKK